MFFSYRQGGMDARLIKNSERLYGCGIVDAIAANDGQALRAAGSFAVAFDKQRSNAARRGVKWLITLPQWADVWKASGRWEQRGKSAGSYCMARNGDAGPYAIGNVSIQPIEINNRAAIARAAIEPSACARLRRGTGRGWTLVAKNARNPYQVTKGGIYIGSFATQQEAEAAYASAP